MQLNRYMPLYSAVVMIRSYSYCKLRPLSLLMCCIILSVHYLHRFILIYVRVHLTANKTSCVESRHKFEETSEEKMKVQHTFIIL